MHNIMLLVTLKQLLLITAECIQMVVGYLDIFVFEEFCFRVRGFLRGIQLVFVLYDHSLPLCYASIEM